ncbi:autotransporter domain-containing protein [Novosphingobium mangrovi (ex Huang et al. 2023)]|uniref:Autotransporter domain-containing protein n=1 Tax=Novosphingobium mangrovi (ex Huang et al. 2023) TaxID=2976432 RepID=A0ABT2I8N7_9SPHN|nr:autotransporter domain-containing protein [Novosphingobium mangrovi (ex Huang et al. 2023)]MCT2401174.1 autotransporter domain-containing protein [Novosphingobium mangrovi (ex Huang et al. 2023)]
MSKDSVTRSRRGARSRLLVSTAAAACGWAALSSPAAAAVPPECSTSGVDPIEVDCVVPAPDTVGQIYTTADSAIVRVGTADTPTSVVVAAGDAVIMTGNDQQALQVAAGSSVTSLRGIGALISTGASGNIFVTGQGDFTGQTDGVRIFSAGSGGLSFSGHNLTGVTGTGLAINTTAGAGSSVLNVTGTAAGTVDGVHIVDESDSSVTASFNNVYGGEHGLHVEKTGNGNINISSSGDIVSAGDAAVRIIHQGVGDVDFISTGSIEGDVAIALGHGNGQLTAILNDVTGNVRTNALLDVDNVTAFSGSLTGEVWAYAMDGDVTLTTQDVAVTVPTVFGVLGYSDGNGDVRVTTEGTVVADAAAAVAGINEGDFGNVAVETDAVVSTVSAIVGQQGKGSQGDITILSHGDLTSGASGIVAYHEGDGTIDIAAEGAFDADWNGISVTHFGNGDISVAASGPIDAEQVGVRLFQGEDGTPATGDVAIATSGAINAGLSGVLVQKIGDGNVAIDATGAISSGDDGINAYLGGQGEMTIAAAADITAGGNGIYAFSTGTGPVSVNAQGIVSGGVSILAQGKGSVKIAAAANLVGDVAAGGDGDVAIDVAGNVTGSNLAFGAVTALNFGTGETSVHVGGDISGHYTGVHVQAVDSSAVVAIDGDISDTDMGVFLRAAEASVELGGVESSDTGLDIATLGTLNATVHGDVVAGTYGLFFTSAGDTAQSLVLEGDVTAGQVGALVNVHGSGDFSLSSQGAITGGVGGMRVEYFGAGSLAVDVNDVSGELGGISVLQGLDAFNATITANGTLSSGDSVAFGAELGGSGAKQVTLNDAISQTGYGALLITGNGTGTSLTVNGTASGAEYGVGVETHEALVLDVNNATASTGQAVHVNSVDSDVTAMFRGAIEGTTRGISFIGDGAGTIDVTIAESADVRASNGVAVDFFNLSSGQTLTLTNNGTITGDGLNGPAVALSNSVAGDSFVNAGTLAGEVWMADGDDSMVNNGAFTGTLIGGDGADSFTNANHFAGIVFDTDGMTVTNMAGALFESAGMVNMGGGTMTNSGVFSSGGQEQILLTEINGNFVQSETGSMLVEVDGGVADRIALSGDASLAGTVDVVLSKPVASNQEYLIVSAVGTVSDEGLTLSNTMELSPLVSLGLDFRNDHELYLTSTVDFSPPGANLDPNQQEIGDEINDVFDADSEPLGDLTDGLLGVDTLDDYGDAINQLVPEIYLNTLQTSLLAAQDFSSELGGCSSRDGRMLADGKSCAKLVLGGDMLDRDGGAGRIGFEDGRLKVQAAYFTPLSDTLTLGLGLGYDDTLIKNDIASRAQGHRFQAGASLTYRKGGFALGGMLTAGFTRYDVSRRIAFGEFAAQSDGDQKLRAFSGELSASYTADLGQLYVKPAVSLVATHLHSGALVEDGGNATDYAIDRISGWHLAARPSLEIGGNFAGGNGAQFQPYARVGATVLFDNDFALTGRFAAAQGLGDGFITRSELDRTIVDVDAGLRVLFGSSSALIAEYVGRYSSDMQSHGFRFRASFAF